MRYTIAGRSSFSNKALLCSDPEYDRRQNILQSKLESSVYSIICKNPTPIPNKTPRPLYTPSASRTSRGRQASKLHTHSERKNPLDLSTSPPPPFSPPPPHNIPPHSLKHTPRSILLGIRYQVSKIADRSIDSRLRSSGSVIGKLGFGNADWIGCEVAGMEGWDGMRFFGVRWERARY